MKIYLVGGAVRDHFLGRIVKDKDYVVVGSSPEEMLALGFEQVGADFPVFLHPRTRQEYALARTERKTGKGYHGFEVDSSSSVTLEQDLLRRDLTINAMAMDLETNEIVDPYGGERDLKQGVLRHVSVAFAEDPLRVLRVARFSARLGFAVAPETMALMMHLVNEGEMQHLTVERVWAELQKALMETSPTRFVNALEACGAWNALFPEVGALACLNSLNDAALGGLNFDQRVAAMLMNVYLAKADNLLARFKAPAETIRLVHNLWKTRIAANTMSMTEDKAHVALELFKATDAYRRPIPFLEALNVLAATTTKYFGFTTNITNALLELTRIDFQSLSDEARKLKGAEIGKAIEAVRLAHLEQMEL